MIRSDSFKQDGAGLKLGIILAFAIFILIGVPIWIKETSVYRSQLSFDSLNQVFGPVNPNIMMSYDNWYPEYTWKVKVVVLVMEGTSESHENGVSDVADSVMEAALMSKRDSLYLISPLNRMRKDTSKKEFFFKRTLDVSFSMVSLPESLYKGKNSDGHHSALLNYTSMIVGPGQYVLFVQQSNENWVEISNTWSIRAVFERNLREISVQGHILPMLSDLLFDKVLPEFQTGSANPSLKPSPKFQITFSLLVEDPSETFVKSWDIKEAIQEYFVPFKELLNDIAELKVDSQILYYTATQVKPKWDNSTSCHWIGEDDLPVFVNSAEWSLESASISIPSIYFNLFIPKKFPLELRHIGDGEKMFRNSFLIPGWGGIHVFEGAIAPDQDHIEKSKLVPVMETFISQMRTLFGVVDVFGSVDKSVLLRSSSSSSSSDVLLLPREMIFISDRGISALNAIEYDKLLLSRTLINLLTAIATLESLQRMLDQITNIPVADGIANKVQSAIYHSQRANSLLKMGKFQAASIDARKALEYAEDAFFDPTMVSMVYFPEEHKYAIYTPLFLPIALPILTSTFKLLREKRKTTP